MCYQHQSQNVPPPTATILELAPLVLVNKSKRCMGIKDMMIEGSKGPKAFEMYDNA